MRLYTLLLYFLQTALHVSDDTFIHHQEHTQTVITTSGTGRTVFVTVRWCEWVGTTVPISRQRMVLETAWPVPDIVTTVWICSWLWMRISSETCGAVCRKYYKIVYSRILLDNYWHWFTMNGPMNIKFRFIHFTRLTRWRIWLRHCATAGRSRVWFPMLSLEFFIDIILPAAQRPWGWLSL